MTRSVDLLIQFLESERARGVTHIMLDEQAREGLRRVHGLAVRQTRAGDAAPPLQETSVAAARGAPGPDSRPAAAAPAPVPAPVPAVSSGTGGKVERLDALRRQAEHWQPARKLGSLRETMVFATGSPDARIVLVGEAPGYEEERQREPFVGPAGQKLTEILRAMGLARDEVYISNIVKFRPATPRQTTNNRPPNPDEMAACLPFIREELEIIRPQCVIALGRTAAEGLLGTGEGVGAMRGRWHEFQGIPTRVTYHPSYLLRSQADLGVKREIWEDMLAVMEQLAMPISEKQRNFFLKRT